MTAPAAYAQRNPEANNRLRNVGSFIATFVDPDNSTNYLNDVITFNQCKKRDLFLLHDLKDATADQMLDNYRTITNSELEDLKTEYALLHSELTYVRNMTDLQGDQLHTVVLNKSNRNYTARVREQLEFWDARYESRLGDEGEYNNCNNSWQSVKEKWIGLSDSIEQIKGEWGGFKEVFKRDEDRERTGNIFTNSFNTIREGAVDSYEQTRDNFRAEVAELRDDLAAISISKEEDYQRAVEFHMSLQGDRDSLANVLEEEDNLTQIPGILRQLDIEADVRQIEAMDDTVIELTAGFTDDLTVVLWDEVLKLNETIQDTNTLMSQEQSGVTAVARSIAARQCRL
jgi:hypothetical protein